MLSKASSGIVDGAVVRNRFAIKFFFLSTSLIAVGEFSGAKEPNLVGALIHERIQKRQWLHYFYME